MKKISTIALLLLVVAMVFSMAACQNDGPQNNDGEIFIEESGMPQLEHVAGEDLDLSNGVLSVKNGDEVKQIPMNDEGITVTGYDKNKLGEQTLTISYNGMTTELKITVVARMQMVDHVTDYLVGDALDLGTGRLKITRNDGSNYTVLLNGNGVEITGFNPDKTGAQTLTAKYTGSDASYECQFTVNVHDVENVEFQAPKKVAYNSHEEGLNLEEGYFTLTAQGGTLVKKVTLTADMISGFDLSAVNEANSPLTQTLTASYKGKSFNYDIKVTYTDISMFKQNTGAFLALDWSGDDIPEYSAELGELALKLMEAYLDMSKADRTYITTEESLSVARVALMYGMDQMDADFVALEGAFVITGGELEFTCINREAVETAIEILENDDCEIYRISPILVDMIELFAEEEVMYDVYFGDFGLLPTELYEQLLEIFDHMLELDDALVMIPSDWQSVGVEAYAIEIENVYSVMYNSNFVEGGMAYVYDYVAAWRAEGDAFDILYHYYYGQNDMEALNFLARVSLPGELDTIATYALMMMEQVELISGYAQMDTTLLMYYYHTTVKLAEELKNGDNEMMKNLYDTLPINGLLGIDDSTLFYFDTLMEHIRTMEGGYYEYSGGLLGLDAYNAIMDKYMELVSRMWEEEGYEDSEEYGRDLEALFHMYVDLMPTQQYYFLNTLNAFYSMSVPPMAFDDTGDYAELMCFFVTVVHDYYRDKLSDSAVVAYNDLVLAIEIYAQRVSYENWVSEFTAKMDNVKAVYAKMNAEDKANFDKYLGFAFEKYQLIRQRFVETTEYSDLGEWADEFAALEEAILNLEVTASYLQDGGTSFNLLYTAYERAERVANYILENAPAEILDIYYHEARYGLDENGEIPEGVITMSFEYMMTTYRTMYVNYLLTSIGYPVYDIYEGSALSDFIHDAYELYWTYMRNKGDNVLSYDIEKVVAVVNAFGKLDIESQILFLIFEGNEGYYYLALDEFVTQEYTSGVGKAVLKLLEMEQQCILYNYYVALGADPSELMPGLSAVAEELQELYNALSDADKATFEAYKEMYDFYMDMYSQIA